MRAWLAAAAVAFVGAGTAGEAAAQDPFLPDSVAPTFVEEPVARPSRSERFTFRFSGARPLHDLCFGVEYDGTADSGADYHGLDGGSPPDVLTLRRGQLNASLELRIDRDGDSEGDETIVFLVSPPGRKSGDSCQSSDSEQGTPLPLTVLLRDSPAAGEKPPEGLSVPHSVTEPSGSGWQPVDVLVMFGSPGAVWHYCFPFEVVGGTATLSDDVRAIDDSGGEPRYGSFVVPPGSASATLRLDVNADELVERGERFRLRFFHPVKQGSDGGGSCSAVDRRSVDERDIALLDPESGSGPAPASVAQLTFVSGSMQITGREPSRLFERDAPQLLDLTLVYTAAAGHEGGVAMHVLAFPLSADPAALVGPEGCATAERVSRGDVSLQRLSYLGGSSSDSGGRTGVHSQANTGTEDEPATDPRDFSAGFQLGILCQDDLEEPVESFIVEVFFVQDGRASARYSQIVRIIDDETSGVGVEIEPASIAVTETDSDAPALITLTFSETQDFETCYAIGFLAGTATDADARITGSGFVVVPPQSDRVLLRDVVIVGDDDVEGSEVFYIEIHAPQRGERCSRQGAAVVHVITVTIEDDDQDTSGISPTEFTVQETDVDAAAALELTFAQAADADYCFAFELAYGRSTAGASDAWVRSSGVSSGSFLLRAGLTEVVVRDLIIAGDDEVEDTEVLYIDVYQRQRASTCSASGSVVTVLTVTIEDDDEDASGISPTEFTVRETDEDAPAALALTFAQAADADYCFAFELAYGRSTAGRDDAWVGPGKASSGSFLLPAGLTEVVVRDFIIAGDDEVEETETLYIDVYERQRSSSCRPSGTVVAVLTVTIEDDDQDASGVSPTEFTVIETDEDAPAALALTFAQAADSDYCFAFELAYGRSTAGRDDAWVGPEKASSGSFLLPAGLTDVVVRDLVVAGDNLAEGSEALYIDVYERQRSSSCEPSGTVVAVLTVTIEDDDQGAQIEFTLTPLVVQEPVRRRQAVVFDLQQSGGPEFSSFTVEWSTAPGTAQTDGSTPDYEPASGSLTFDSGVTRRYLSIVLFGDLVREPEETFFVSVRSVVSPDVSVVSEARFEVTITEDDRECLTLPEEVTVPEGPSGARAGVSVPVQVGCLVGERRTLLFSAFETGGGRAARGSPPHQDFEPVEGLVHVVPAGVFEVDVPVTVVLGDNRPEPATETFAVSVALASDSGAAGLSGSTTVLILDDEVYFDEVVTLESPDSLPEGDPPFGADCGAHQYRVLPDACARGVPLLLTLNERFSHDLEFELYTLAETARADVDYQSIRGRRLVVREGHLVSFDVHDPLQLRVVPDLLPEPQEALSLFLYGRYPGNPVPAFAQRIRIVIEDDDELADGTDVPWFGPDAELCTEGSPVLAVQEPSVTDGLAVLRVDLAHRVRRRSEGDAGSGQVNELLSCDLPDGAAVGVRVDLVSPGLSNAGDPGLDVVLPEHSRWLVFYQGQPAPIELFVRGDGLPEGREELDLLLSTGKGGHARLRVVVEDFEATVEAARGRAASLVRAGRLLGAALTDAVAARFSCAGSSACAPFEDSREALFPQRLAGALRALWPLHAPGVGPGATGAGCAGSRCAGLGTYPAHVPGSLERAGRLVEALAFQGDPQRWFFGGRSRRASPWSLWLRGSAQTDIDATAGGSALETGLVTALTGVDRMVGRLRVGGVYGWSFGAYSRRHARGSFAPDVTDVPLRWHLVAPYVGFVPTDRVRFWTSVGIGWGGSHVAPADGRGRSGTTDPEPSLAVLHYGASGASQRLRLYAGGGAVSLGSVGAFEFDLEGDWFRVRLVHGGAGVIADASPASRLRAGVRAGTRLGGAGSSSYLSFAVARRWDAGADVEWVRGVVDGEAAGATDAAVDYSFRRPRSRLAWTATVQMQVAGGGSAPGLVTASGVALQRSVRRMTASGGLRWGSSETGRGWSLALRPGYGSASLRRAAWWDAAALGGMGVAFPAVVPTLDAEVGYGFAGGGQAAVTFGQGFSVADRSGRGASVGVRFDRGW